MSEQAGATNPRVSHRQARRVNAALRSVGLRGMEVTREMLLESLRQKATPKQLMGDWDKGESPNEREAK